MKTMADVTKAHVIKELEETRDHFLARLDEAGTEDEDRPGIQEDADDIQEVLDHVHAGRGDKAVTKLDNLDTFVRDCVACFVYEWLDPERTVVAIRPSAIDDSLRELFAGQEGDGFDRIAEVANSLITKADRIAELATKGNGEMRELVGLIEEVKIAHRHMDLGLDEARR